MITKLAFITATIVLSVIGAMAQLNPRLLESKRQRGRQVPPTTSEQTAREKTDTHTSPLVILEKPRAAYPDQSSGSVCVQGAVILRIQFLDTGEIGTISAVKRLPYGLTENAVEAAKKIKFEPAKKGGKAITVTRQVEYSFSIY